MTTITLSVGKIRELNNPAFMEYNIGGEFSGSEDYNNLTFRFDGDGELMSMYEYFGSITSIDDSISVQDMRKRNMSHVKQFIDAGVM